MFTPSSLKAEWEKMLNRTIDLYTYAWYNGPMVWPDHVIFSFQNVRSVVYRNEARLLHCIRVPQKGRKEYFHANAYEELKRIMNWSADMAKNEASKPRSDRAKYERLMQDE